MHELAFTGGPRAQERVGLLVAPAGELTAADLRLLRVNPAR